MHHDIVCVDVNAKKSTCYMIDLIQSKRNYKSIGSSVCTVVERLQHLEGLTNYQNVEWRSEMIAHVALGVSLNWRSYSVTPPGTIVFTVWFFTCARYIYNRLLLS